MNKIKIFFRRLFGGSFKRMFRQISLVHKETGNNRVAIFFDMVWCIFRYGVGYQDYRVYGFGHIHGKEKRSTFLNMNLNMALSHYLNSPDYFELFYDKALFNEAFRDYLGRDFIDLRHVGEKDFENFCKGKRTVFAKRVSDFGGVGITREIITPETDFSELYKRLYDNKQFLIEEEVVQHETMSKMFPSSVNTIRVVTIHWKGVSHVLYALLRIGVGDNCVDNICAGGIYTSVSDDGIIRKFGTTNEAGGIYERHPDTGVELKGFEIPLYAEAIKLCKDLAAEYSMVGYIAWDVAITPEKPVLIEGNTLPGHDVGQNYVHIDNDTGLMPKLIEIFGKDFLKHLK